MIGNWQNFKAVLNELLHNYQFERQLAAAANSTYGQFEKIFCYCYIIVMYLPYLTEAFLNSSLLTWPVAIL